MEAGAAVKITQMWKGRLVIVWQRTTPAGTQTFASAAAEWNDLFAAPTFDFGDWPALENGKQCTVHVICGPPLIQLLSDLRGKTERYVFEPVHSMMRVFGT